MKCAAIFCCLLAYCVFEIVLAEFQDDLATLYTQSVKQIEDFISKKNKTIQTLIKDGEKKKKDLSDCKTNFNTPINNTVSDGERLLWDNCINTATESKDLKAAEDCAGLQVNSSLAIVKLIADNTENCIIEKVDMSL